MQCGAMLSLCRGVARDLQTPALPANFVLRTTGASKYTQLRSLKRDSSILFSAWHQARLSNFYTPKQVAARNPSHATYAIKQYS